MGQSEKQDNDKGDELIKTAPKYTVYRKFAAPGWHLCKVYQSFEFQLKTQGIAYLSHTIWETDSQGDNSQNSIEFIDGSCSFALSIRKVVETNSLGLFSDDVIPKETCLGEFTGTGTI
jgi:hypothetical protein